eukprot:321650-Prymnesium_polylepis.1
MPRHAMPCHATPRHAMPCHAMPCHATPCHATPRHAMPRHAMPRHAMPCHARTYARGYRAAARHPRHGAKVEEVQGARVGEMQGRCRCGCAGAVWGARGSGVVRAWEGGGTLDGTSRQGSSTPWATGSAPPPQKGLYLVCSTTRARASPTEPRSPCGRHGDG